jgi:hypothetical protein
MEETGRGPEGTLLLISFVVLFIGLVIVWFNLRAENRRRRKRNEPDAES